MNRTPTLLALAVSVLLLSGCTRPQVLQTSTPEAFDTSLLAIKQGLSDPQVQALDAALRDAKANTPFRNGKSLFDIAFLEGRLAEDIIYLHLKLVQPLPERLVLPDFPNASITRRIKRMYEIEQSQLEKSREDAVWAGQQLVDQFPITNFQFMPPRDAGDAIDVQATFSVTIRNGSPFDAYRPLVQVSVTHPDAKEPLFQRTFQNKEDKEPIGPGEFRTVEFECCGLFTDPFNYDVMAKLPRGANITAKLVNVVDHAGREMVAVDRFSTDDVDRLDFVSACIEALEDSESHWTPPPDGFECMTEKQQVAAKDQLAKQRLRAIKG